MSNDNRNADDRSINYEPIEDAVDDAQAALDAVDDAVGQRWRVDIEDLQDQLEHTEDAVDDAQDEDDTSYLGAVPATVNYLQRASENLVEQVDAGADELENFATAMEGVEDSLRGVDIEARRWFASVNGVPLIYDERTTEVSTLITDALGEDADPSNYTLEAYSSPADDDPNARYNRPEQEVDLSEYRHFRTAADKGGGPV